MSDLIDRDETIKQFCKQDCGCDPRDCPGKTCYEVEIIESVPTHTTPANTLGALDCVSREDLTKGIETYFGDLPITVHYDMLALAQKLPSVQPEREKGKWLKAGTRMGIPLFECSLCECGDEVPTVMGKPSYNFCPYCGADMRGEEQ